VEVEKQIYRIVYQVVSLGSLKIGHSYSNPLHVCKHCFVCSELCSDHKLKVAWIGGGDDGNCGARYFLCKW
jgi:hypothetical protein